MLKPIAYKKVVVIDDDPINNMICEKLIQHLGFAEHVCSFLSAAEALAWLQNHPDSPVDLILLDINLPIMDGWEFLAQLQQLQLQGYDIPFSIHIHSSSVSQEDQEKASRHPLVKSFLLKPLTPDKLAQLA